MDELPRRFSTLATSDEAEEKTFYQDMFPRNKNLRALPPDPATERNMNLDDSGTPDPARLGSYLKAMEKSSKPVHAAPKILPCANVQVAKYSACEKPGTMACSACKLVSYCSKECQKAHWRSHKRDCQNFMRSDDWKPIWIMEHRLPSFYTEAKEDEQQKMEYSVGLSLWGNTPAMDVINLDFNENDSTKDLSLAFIASGDLCHVLRSVNALPPNYSGNLSILLNDLTLAVVCRNIVLLVILGNISDEAMAADIALHFWYSVFMPTEYRLQITLAMVSFLQKMKDNTFAVPVGPRSTLSVCLPEEAKKYFSHFISFSTPLDEIQDEYDRVRNAPSRRDFRDRLYANLTPSHRVAFQEYRRFGILLPFGAINAHFNCPNLSLFSTKGKWWQTDYADPLGGWDIGTVIETGKAHGAHVEDIYGCLYFYLSEQLRMFAHRLRTFPISFRMFSLDARDLPVAILQDEFAEYFIPPSIRFDRIEVSNILDHNYVGIRDVLVKWAPLLAKSKNAAIVGYFMNWAMIQKDGRALTAGQHVMGNLLPRMLAKNKGNGRTHKFMDPMQSMMLFRDDINALYDNSKPFSNYLKKQGLDAVLRQTGLRLRDKHTVVPHRTLTPLRGSPNGLPEFPNDESWYYYTKLTSSSWAERFVEFEQA